MFFFCILIIELQNVDRLHCQSLLCCTLLRAVTFFSLQNRTTILDDRKYIFVGKRWTLLLNVFYDLVVAYPNFHFPPSLPKIFCVVCFEAMPRGILHKKTISPKFNRAKRALGIFKKVRCFVGLPSNVWMWICTADILRLKSMKCYKGILNHIWWFIVIIWFSARFITV